MKRKVYLMLKILRKIIFFGLLIISIWFSSKVLKMNIIPSKYLSIGLPLYCVVLVILGLLIFIRRVPRIFKVISSVISVIFIVLIFFINNYIIHTDNFIDKIKEKDYILKSYYVIALADNKYKNVSDFNSIGIYSSDDDYKNAVNQLTSNYNIALNNYDNFDVLNDSLFNKTESIILVSSSDRGILMDKIEKYDEKTAIIATLYVKKANDVVKVEVEVTEKPFNVLITGIDIAGDISTVSRSDVNMIVTVNPRTHEILLTSIPRDYYVNIPGKGMDKLTHAGLYGANTSVETLENLFDINIDYYLKVNFSTLISVVDLIGGIQVYSDKTFTTYNDKNCHIVKGNNYFDGKCALAFSRERYAYTSGDLHRIENQQDVLMAILNKTITSKEAMERYFDLLNILGDSFQTNMSRDKIYQLINMQLNNMQPWKMDTYCLSGYNDFKETYSYNFGKLYVMHPNMNAVKEANNKINKLLSK